MIPLLSLIGENNNEFANQIFYSHSISITPKIHLLFLAELSPPNGAIAPRLYGQF